MSWQEAVEMAESLLDRIDELPERAEDFAIGVEEKVRDMLSWMKKHHDVTPRIVDALDNISRGVERWFS